MTNEQHQIFHPLIWVEGTVGAGKTSFSREVGARLNLRVIEEPVTENGLNPNPYLSLFYQDPAKYAFGMQVFLLHKRYIMQRLAADEATGVGGYHGAILDRSLSGDRVFAKLHLDVGNISLLDWQTYEMAYSFMCRSLLPPTLLVFLDVQPETAYERMRRRDRKAEVNVSLEYLQQLRIGYQHMLQEAETGLLPWAHSVRIARLVWDPDTVTSIQWDATAKTVRDACRMI